MVTTVPCTTRLLYPDVNAPFRPTVLLTRLPVLPSITNRIACLPRTPQSFVSAHHNVRARAITTSTAHLEEVPILVLILATMAVRAVC